MELYGSHFEYAGVKSRMYDLVFANVETSRFTSVSGETKSISLFNKRNQKNYYIESDFSDSPISFDAEVVSEHPLSRTDQREIERWLFFRNDYKPLYFDIEDDCLGEAYDIVDGSIKRFYLNCRFINPEKLEYHGGIVGYKFIVECDSPAAWQDTISKTFTINGTSGKYTDITLNVDTDLNEYVYPHVRITMGSSGGDIYLANNTDDSTRLTSFTDVQPTVTFRMDGRTNYISGNYYTNFIDKNFLRLLDGANTIRVAGNITSITFEWQNRRYL